MNREVRKKLVFCDFKILKLKVTPWHAMGGTEGEKFESNHIFILGWPCIIYNFSLFRFQFDTLIILYIYNLGFLSLSTCFGPIGPSLGDQTLLSHKQTLAPFPRWLSVLCGRWCYQRPPKTDNDRGNGARGCLCDIIDIKNYKYIKLETK
jgi:hypothetical protein